MALQVVAVLAALAAAQKVLDFPLVRRMLCNLAGGTSNQIDDWVIGILYGQPEKKVPAKLAEAQADYNAMPADEKAAMKVDTPLPPAVKDAVDAAPYCPPGIGDCEPGEG